MRFLFSIFTCCFFLLAPSQGRAGDKAAQKFSKPTSKFPKAGFINYLLNHDCPAIVTSSNQVNSSGNRGKTFSPGNFLQAVSFAVNRNILPAEKYSTTASATFTPIGLRLIFPKHYFW